MRLGRFQLTFLSGGRFRIDGGTMFGVVPKALWARDLPTDHVNTIPQDTNCVLVETGRKRLLIDTGIGTKLSDKLRRLLQIADAPADPLAEGLQALGLSPADIDVVVLSHLHFDHAGGATRHDEAGEAVPVFPNAEYVVHRREWAVASADFPELRDAYPRENFQPLQENGRLRLVDGDAEIVPGVRAVLTGGHTEGHAAIRIDSDGQTAVYLGDICPTTHHLPVNWCMAYDTHMLQTRRVKRDLLTRIAENGWWALFDHDPATRAARLQCDDRGRIVVVADSAIGQSSPVTP
jgi:glyoxylase-like metal-dependent hydrolase (beta-lactamase superfamily II)